MEPADNPDSTRARELLTEISERRNQGWEDLAFTLSGECLYLARRAGDSKAEARALLSLADLAFHYNPSGEDAFALCKKHAEDALRICRANGDDAGASASLRTLASIAGAPASLELLNEAMSLADRSRDRRQVANTLDRMAAIVGMRDSAKAAEYGNRALEIYRELNDVPGQALALRGLSIFAMGPDPSTSRAFASQALDLYRELGYKKPITELLMFIWSGQSDDLSEAREAALVEGRKLSQELEIPMWESIFIERLAEIAEARGEHTKSKDLLARAREIDNSPQLDPETMKKLEDAFAAGDPNEAQDAVRKAFFGGGAQEEDA